MLVIGLDIGTSGVKSTVFDENAAIVSHSYEEYEIICEGPGLFELNPVVLRDAAFRVLALSLKNVNRHEVRAICVTSFGESFVCLDAQDHVLCNTMIYMDKRGTEECGEFKSLLGEDRVFSVCGQYLDPMFALYKIKWMQKHRRQVMGKVKRICFIADYLTYSLGADHLCDYSLAARSAMFDIGKKKWWNEGVAFSELDPAAFPNAVPSGSVVGTLSKAACRLLGLHMRVKLIIGGHDQIVAAVGGGAHLNGDMVNGVGTVDCMTTVFGGQQNSQEFLAYNFPVVPYIKEGQYVTYAFNMSGGCVLKWFRNVMAKDLNEDAYDLLDKETPQEPTGILMLPYLAGAGTPTMDAHTPAVIAGLRYSTSRGELFRAFMEGETYEMKTNIDCMKKAGIEVSRVITVGGGSHSDIWMQIRADIFNKPVEIPAYREAGTLGSAMFCYASTGIFDSVEQAQIRLVHTSKLFKPAAENAKMYEKNYAQYKKMYEWAKESFK